MVLEDIPTFTPKNGPNVGEDSIHGAPGIYVSYPSQTVGLSSAPAKQQKMARN